MAGKEVKEIYRSLNSANVEENFDAIISRLDVYFVPKKNLSYDRYVFKKVKQLSTVDSTTYVTRLRTYADSCEYSEMENEIRIILLLPVVLKNFEKLCFVNII